jgi:hypothetical protein
LTSSKKYGYDFSDYIIDLIDKSILVIPNLTTEEGQNNRKLEFTNLHFGEIGAISESKELIGMIKEIESRDRIKIKNK